MSDISEVLLFFSNWSIGAYVLVVFLFIPLYHKVRLLCSKIRRKKRSDSESSFDRDDDSDASERQPEHQSLINDSRPNKLYTS